MIKSERIEFMDIIIAGDLVPTQNNIDLFVNGDMQRLFGEDILSLWHDANIRIFNLETPITDSENPIAKSGPNLIAATKAFNGIKALNASALCTW